jgi:endonuclease YncB( thermonuclease family)
MLRAFVLLAVVCAALGVIAAAVSGGESLPRVTSVADGDTLRVSTGDRVRLVQIDTPELGGRECYSLAAATELKRLVPPGTPVLLEPDSRLDRVDRYGRLLRYVWKGDVNVNQELVRRGAATVYFFRGDRGKYASRLLAAQAEARQARRGLWGACPRARVDPGRAADTGSG